MSALPLDGSGFLMDYQKRSRPMMSSMDRGIFGRPSVNNRGKFMNDFGRQFGEMSYRVDQSGGRPMTQPVFNPQPTRFDDPLQRIGGPVQEFKPIKRPSFESLQQPQFGQKPQANQQGMQQMMQMMQQMMQMISQFSNQGGYGGGMGGGFGGGFMNQGPYGGGFGQGGYQQPRQRPMPMPNMFGGRGRGQFEMQYGFDGRPIGMGPPTNRRTFA